MVKQEDSVGVVKTKYFEFSELVLDSGQKLSPVKIAYETYGRLNRNKSNAILICHALSGDAHAAGKHRKNSRKHGWYAIAIGPGKTFDTRKYFIICSNVIGGCKGSTGPSSINPKTKKPYGLDFPLITIRDMVHAQKKLIDHLGIQKLFCITGGSMGGFHVLEWTVSYSDSVHLAIPIATSAKQYPMGIVFHDIGRKAILNDPDWQNGNYYGKARPEKGLSLARQIGHVTYLSQDTLLRKFDRQKKKRTNGKFGVEFEIQGYFNYKGESFVRRFDANSYLYITDAIDHFDLTQGGRKRLKDVFKEVKAKFLLISFTSDWLYPPEQVEEIYSALAEAGVRARYRKLDLPYGHDAFLVYNNTLGNVLVDFLNQEAEEYLNGGGNK
ncbi:MAG: homoserine O-acetyltransferase [Candidatus Altiarchaeota archaeon]